jgi:multiple sugar transport system ATP-binding protein
MPDLELRAVSKSYAAGQRAVDRVSLSVESGELLVLVGPSGCGKSSLLRMIAGLEDVSEGEIAIGGRVVNALPPGERDIAMVFQNYALYPHMTVFENMAFGLRLRKRPRAEVDQRVRETAAMLGLESLLDRHPRALSGGERQRVALGRAMVRHPQVFLFDEPLSNLDARLRVQMRGEIHRLHQRLKSTMVYVTHDQVEAMTLGERIAVLKSGVLQQVADPHTLYHRPANRFVAGFIGSPPMNFLDAAVDGEGAVTLPGTAAFRPAPAPPALAGRRGRAVTLGVRPEDLTLKPAGDGGSLAATLDVREPLGNEELLYWSTAAGPVVSRLAGEAGPPEGARVTLHFRHDRLRWFDPEGGAALEER